jgi:hypothetical protein
MRFKVKRYEHNRVRNVHGKVISRTYSYIIVVRRWFKKPMYLRLLPGWYDLFTEGGVCKVELTSNISNATDFRDDDGLRKAEKVIRKIKEEPDKFVLN